MKNTDSKLFEQVHHIVNQIENGAAIDCEYMAAESGLEVGDIMSGLDYLSDTLDIEFIPASDKTPMGARILVASGGPNIWINTRDKTVEGTWWMDKCIMPYDKDVMDLDEAVETLYHC